MGISGLLPLLKSIHKPTQIAKFKGQTIGVDGYVWLHRGAVSCAIQLALGQPTTKYVEFAMSRVRMLQHFGVTPYIVFDGDALPSKAGTNQQRREQRQKAKKLGQELLQLGKTAQANLELQKAISITHEMAGMFIRELKKANVKYIVAPYEADAQLAYLEKHGHIQGVISEDSDLLVFGVKTLLTKLDQYGECVMVRREEFGCCREISLAFWTDDQFRQMAILSGCDYINNITNLGLKTAYRLLQKHKTVERVLQAIRLEGKLKVPDNYAEDFRRAELTFLYQWVFCPTKQALVNLNEAGENADFSQMPFIGEHIDAETASRIATGELHPRNRTPIVLPNADSTFSRPSWRTSAKQQENLASKKGLSITEFFRKRQPLAELDPNSFVLTPQQSELARRASASTWATSLVGAADSPSVVTTVQPTVADDRSQRRLSTVASPPIAKRQRLCHDDVATELGTTSKSHMSLSSKYFGTSRGPKIQRTSKRKSGGFQIFSDDSIDEALASMPEPQTSNPTVDATTKAEPVISEADTAKFEQSEDADDSQATFVDVNQVVGSPFFDDAEQTFVEEVSYSPTKERTKSLLDKFSLSPTHSIHALGISRTTTQRMQSLRHTANFKSSRRQMTPATKEPSTLARTSEQSRAVVPKAPGKRASAFLTPKDVLERLAATPGSEDQLAETSESDDSDDRTLSNVLDVRRFAFSNVM